MRVGLVIYGDLGTVSGGYLYDRQLVAALRAAGHTVEIISLPWRDYCRHLTDNLSPAIAARVHDDRFDLLLQDELNHPSLALMNRWPRRRRVPIVAIVHHLRSDETWDRWRRQLYRTVERAYLTTVDAFVCNSTTTRRAVERLTTPGRPACVAMPAGDRFAAEMTPGQVRTRASECSPLRVLFVGNVIPRKGLHVLVDALARLPRGACTVTVAGSLRVDRPYAGAVGSQIARTGLAPWVRLLGQTSNTALADLLATAHVLAVPSEYEGFGIAYLEGMAFGLPAIAARAGGASDLVDDGVTGWLVPPDAAVVATALSRLATDRALLARMGCAALERFHRHPTWADTTERLVAFLEQVASSP